MPKNKGKGGKNRRRGKNENDKEKRDIETIDKSDPNMIYASIISATGGGYFKASAYQWVVDLEAEEEAEGNEEAEGKDKRGKWEFIPDIQLHVRGKLRKKLWINKGDIVAASKRDYSNPDGDQNDVVVQTALPSGDNKKPTKLKGDIVQKYTAESARTLKDRGELPPDMKINDIDMGGNDRGDDPDVEFADERDWDENADDDAIRDKKVIDIDDI